MKKKNWIYALIVTLIIIIAIVSMIFFVQTKYGDQSEKGSQSVSNKNNKIHIAIVFLIDLHILFEQKISY
ncbi:protein esaA [Staphylococcus aureus F29447]|nr:protein esaA [Staphylococcus aureus F29447]